MHCTLPAAIGLQDCDLVQQISGLHFIWLIPTNYRFWIAPHFVRSAVRSVALPQPHTFPSNDRCCYFLDAD